MKPPSKPPPAARAAAGKQAKDRRDRAAEALRQNLRRRKTQARGRKIAAADSDFADSAQTDGKT